MMFGQLGVMRIEIVWVDRRRRFFVGAEGVPLHAVTLKDTCA